MSSGPSWTDRDAAGGLVRAGRTAWALLGIVGLLVVAWLAVSHLTVVVVPLLLALFPAAALMPLVRWLARHRVPPPLGALISVVVGLGVVAGVFALVVPSFAEQLPALGRSLTRSAGQLDRLLQRLPFTGRQFSVQQLVEWAGTQLGGPGGLLSLLGGAASVLAGLVLLVVVLFFYLAQGRWLVSSITAWLPDSRRAQADELLGRLWFTIGAYFRSLLVVALVDATLIGIGLVLLDVPLALPLAVLVYVGAFFPFIGATVSGLLAVLVAFADGGLWLALAVLGLVLGVQFLEGNVIEPLVMGKLIRLPALAVLLAIAAGATLLGVFGAFIAAPAAACAERAVEFLREQRAASMAATVGSEPDDRRAVG